MRNLLHLRKSSGELKSDGEITIRLPIADWGGNEMATEAHCDAGDISTRGGAKRRFGSSVLSAKR